MAKKGINREIIFEEAKSLIEEKGYDKFSLRELAIQLDVKPASLYSHIKGIEEIAAKSMEEAIKKAVCGKTSDEAFVSGINAYRDFAMKNPELYKAFIHMPSLNDERIMHTGFKSFLPLVEIIKEYNLSKEDTLNYIRALRAMMHVFIELTNNGFMQRGNVSQDESYNEIIRGYLEVLKEKAEKKENKNV